MDIFKTPVMLPSYSNCAEASTPRSLSGSADRQFPDSSKYTWTNWDTQNDVLLTLSHMVLRKIVQVVRDCVYWSLAMDESQDITVKEQIVFAVRIVQPETFEVSEQFLGFAKTAETTGDTLAKLAEVSNCNRS